MQKYDVNLTKQIIYVKKTHFIQQKTSGTAHQAILSMS